MAEEKYLFAFEVDNKDDLKDNLPECNGCVCFPCDETCIGRKKAISRQEAIERMVLAMHNEEIKRSIKDIPCDYRNLAEAALNALLEAQNER